MLALSPPLSNVSIAADRDDYAVAVTAVETAMVEINTTPEHGAAALRAALEQLHAFAPLLAEDPQALELRTLAELALARAELARGDRYAASATIDATLEGLGGRTLPSENLGPSLGALVDERAAALAARGSARLRIECSVACRVLVDERNAGDVEESGSARELSLPLGKHRVWVEEIHAGAASSADRQPLRTTLSLDAADERVTLRYPEVSPAEDEFAHPNPYEVDELPRTHRRVAPRWAEIVPLAAGGAALVAGAVLWALDSRCPGGADPGDVAACPELYDTRAAGIALVSAGFAAGLTGGVMLVVDETRIGQRRGHELGLVWTASF